MKDLLHIECLTDGKPDTLTVSTSPDGLLVLSGTDRFIMKHTHGMICYYLFGPQGKALYKQMRLFDYDLEYLESWTIEFNENNFKTPAERVNAFYFLIMMLASETA